MTDADPKTWPDQADYRCPRSRLVPVMSALTSAGYLAAAGWGLPVFSRFARDLSDQPESPDFAVSLLWVAWAAIVAAALWHARQAVLGVMLTRNVLVRVEPGCLTMVDYAGRAHTLAWHTVTELRAIGRLSIAERGVLAEVYGGGRRLKISRLIEYGDQLAEEITARAGLSVREPRWWGVRYRRPRPPA